MVADGLLGSVGLDGSIAGPRAWNSSSPILAPVADGTHPIVSVKDPTIVQYDGCWNFFEGTPKSVVDGWLDYWHQLFFSIRLA